MNTIIEKALMYNRCTIKKMTFSAKIKTLFKNSLISEEEKKLLSNINKHRNKIAHDLNYNLTFDILFNLVLLSVKAKVDFSDHAIYEDKKLSEEWYGIGGIINEIFPNIFFHLFFENKKFFQDNEFFWCLSDENRT